jgi:hypothetical protein
MPTTETIALLDVTRTVLTEIPLSKVRNASDFAPNTAGRNLVCRWPSTLTWTLQPVNTMPDFSESPSWEAVKLRLSDFNFDGNYWVEFPEGIRRDQGADKWDYFYHGVVTKENVPAGYPFKATGSGGLLMAGVDPIAPDVVVPPQNLQQENGVLALITQATYPVNQGWHIRFQVEGRTSYRRTGILDFLFGEYLLRLNTSGWAELHQTADSTNYTQVYYFQWSDAEAVHSKWHSMTIFPHARNKIEFLSKSFQEMHGRAEHVHDMKGLYELPGELQRDPTTGQYLITASAPFAVRIHREFRPQLQVSRLAFYNGAPNSTAGAAYLYDSPINLPFAPTVMPFEAIDVDLNGGSGTYGIADPATGANWVPGGSAQFQFYAAFQGLGDIPGPGLASSTTPEIYRFAFEKPALYQTLVRNTVATPVQSVTIDTGDSAEAERLTLELDNSRSQHRTDIGRIGQLEAFAHRPHIPLAIIDGGAGNYWFEGTAFGVKSGEAPSRKPRSLGIEARGMAYSLMRHQVSELIPDFGADPLDNLQPWFWDDALVRSFMACGFDASQVVIEEAAQYRFRFWETGNVGGVTGGSGATAGHNQAMGTRWKPAPYSIWYEFIAHIIEDVLGWHFTWDKRDHCWHIYKRPNPSISVDQYKLTPKATFYNTTAEARKVRDNILPSYAHAGLEFETEPPKFTSFIISAAVLESGILSREGVSNVIINASNGGALPTDPAFEVTDRRISCTFDNFNGYANAAHPNPDMTSPDYLGEALVGSMSLSVPNREAMHFIGRNIFYENCFGHLAATWESWWGDYVTANLRKWDVVILDSGPHFESEMWFIDRIEPKWSRDTNIRAKYRAWKLRWDAPPPR